MPVDLTNLDLDLTLLQEIADGSDEFIVESIDMFLQQTPTSIQEVSTALNDRNWAAAASAAHKMKATLGFFGMLNSQALIQQIELGCKSGAPYAEDITAKLNEVQTLVIAATVALLKIKEEAAAGL